MPSTADGLAAKVRGKWWALQSLAQFIRYFENWPEVWKAYKAGAAPPPLRFRGGLLLEHGAGDDPIGLFREIFVDECYTGEGFFDPKPGDTVIDLGANIGTFALFLQWKAPGVQVHCFEPSRETRRRLERNVELNGLQDRVRIHPFAVSDRRKTIALNTGKLTGQSSLFASEFSSSQPSESVECLSLSEAVALCGAAKVDLLKIDAEGSEIEIAEGAGPGLWPRVDRVSFEYHDRIRPGCRARVSAVLAAHGFDDIREAAPPPAALSAPLAGMGIARARRGPR